MMASALVADVGDQHDEQDEDRAASHVRGDEHQAAVDAVDEDARRRREDDSRHEERQEQQADRRARAGDVGDHDGQPEEHHVAADLAGDLRQPERQEPAVAQDAADRRVDVRGASTAVERPAAVADAAPLAGDGCTRRPDSSGPRASSGP